MTIPSNPLPLFVPDRSTNPFFDGRIRFHYDSLKRPLMDLRISVTDRCNFHCVYCHPKNILIKEKFSNHDFLTFNEIERVVTLCKELGVSKIRLTGGEPLLRYGIVELVRRLSGLKGECDFAMTTNGFFFAEYAEALKEAGLKRVTFSMDAVEEKKFLYMTGGQGDLKAVFRGIAMAEKVGLMPVKINAVVMRGINDDIIFDFISRFADKPYSLRFIEFMDVGNINQWQEKHVIPSEELLNKIQKSFLLEPLSEERYGETAKRFKICGGKADIGFISSVTQPFCGSCTRLRLSADGKLYSCLFSDKHLDLKAMLRCGVKDELLLKKIKDFWSKRSDRYSELRRDLREQGQSFSKVEMFRMGG